MMLESSTDWGWHMGLDCRSREDNSHNRDGRMGMSMSMSMGMGLD